MKKISALFLAMILSFSLAPSAFATGISREQAAREGWEAAWSIVAETFGQSVFSESDDNHRAVQILKKMPCTLTPSLGGQFNVTIDELFSATGIATFYRCKKMNNSIWPYADGGPVDLYEVETFLICKPELYEKESFPAVSGPIFLVNAASGNEQARYYDLRE